MSQPFAPRPQPGELVTQPTSKPTRKTVSGTSGATVGGAIGVLMLGWFSRKGMVFSAEEASAVALIMEGAVVPVFAGLGAFVMAWLTRDRAP